MLTYKNKPFPTTVGKLTILRIERLRRGDRAVVRCSCGPKEFFRTMHALEDSIRKGSESACSNCTKKVKHKNVRRYFHPAPSQWEKTQ